MAFVNLKKREMQAKIVYYGPGRCGKTSNLQYIFSRMRDQIKSNMVSVKTEGDCTLFFDYMPLDIGKIKGFDVKIQLYTVPGQVMYESTRKLVLKGADGVVFVADSREERRQKNRISLKSLQDNLKFYGKSIFKVPLVIQYNKRDLAGSDIPVLDIDSLENDLNRQLKVPYFEASAVSGDMVIPTLKKIMGMTMASLEDEFS
ncbi:MAG: GTPase domain-containing protein [Proteobacteria bacterium]|nr:GTPase domain-containing protein [Pseudomonadota bacterium]